MRSRIFKSVAVAFIGLLAIGNTCFAQDGAPAKPATDSVVPPVPSPDMIVMPGITLTSPVQVSISPVKVDVRQLKADLKELKVTSKAQVKAIIKDLNVDITANVRDVVPQINLDFKDGYDGNITNQSNSDNDEELVKNYSKTYPVDANDNLTISNRYGKVVVNTWARNEIKVDVQIKAGADDHDMAQKLLDNVTIDDSKSGNSVSFRTNISALKSSWFSFGGDHNHHMEINYTVYMPAKNDLTIDNRYGAIEIPDMDGKVTINSAYGSFKGGALPGQSDIQVKYGSADIESVGTCAIEVGYGGLNVGSANKIAANISYSGIKIGKLHESAAINIKYGDGVMIGDMDRGVKNLTVSASYTNVNIGLSGDENANFEVVTHYGGFDYDDHDVTVTSKSPDDSNGHPHFTKSYKGYLGKGGSDKNIVISSNYGSVKFQ